MFLLESFIAEILNYFCKSNFVFQKRFDTIEEPKKKTQIELDGPHFCP